MVKVIQHHTVVRDGFHNMLTDLVYWRDYYWLTYCRRTGHYSPDGEEIVLRSVDLKRWHEVARFKTVGDDREPKFCIANDRLFLYFGTFFTPIGWGPGPFVTHVTYTDDGVHWSQPVSAWKDDWIWRVRFFNNTFYGTSYGFGPTGDICDHNHGPLKFLRKRYQFIRQEALSLFLPLRLLTRECR